MENTEKGWSLAVVDDTLPGLMTPYPGFIVMNTAPLGFNFISFPSNRNLGNIWHDK